LEFGSRSGQNPMTIQEWGSIGEIIGGVAVVISIIYLAIQIRSNTRAARASASFDATHSWATLNEKVAFMDDRTMKVTIHSYKPETRWGEIEEVDRARISLLHRALFQKLEGQYYLYQYGLLEAGVWSKRKTWAAGLIQLPFYSEWWAQEKQQLIYSDAFTDAIDNSAAIKVGAAGADPG